MTYKMSQPPPQSAEEISILPQHSTMKTNSIILTCVSIFAIDAISNILVKAQSIPITSAAEDMVTLVYAMNVGSLLQTMVPQISMKDRENCVMAESSTEYLNRIAKSYHRQFAKVEPDINDQKLSSSNLLFQAGILSIKASPTQFISDSANEFVTWYENKHGKANGDTRSAGEKLLHFSIEGLFLDASDEHREWQERFQQNFEAHRAKHGH